MSTAPGLGAPLQCPTDGLRLKWARTLGGEFLTASPRETGQQPLLAGLPGLPEHSRVHSTSRTGLAIWHKKSWRPLHCRAEAAPQGPTSIVPKERLLYLALYRHKIAEHEAKRERQERVQRAAEEAARKAGLEAGCDASEKQASGAGPVAPPEEARRGSRRSPRTPGAALTHLLPSPNTGLGTCVASESAVATSRSKDASATTHVASVTAVPPSGGISEEHLEMRRLGKLFDEWAARESLDSAGIAPPTPSGGASPSGAARVASPQRAKRRGVQTTSLRSAKSCDASNPEESCSEAAKADLGARGFDRVRMERVFNVITNPKVPKETIADRTASELSSRPAPTHIEGFPSIKLMRLYKGPWRMNA
mmetsp:Transcript_40039/g.87420  ORF Transcript_40039/g.87420 Transcript_40039/m.87420 type:complete len:365 (-) Transcript_40039:73-1167(-)